MWWGWNVWDKLEFHLKVVALKWICTQWIFKSKELTSVHWPCLVWLSYCSRELWHDSLRRFFAEWTKYRLDEQSLLLSAKLRYWSHSTEWGRTLPCCCWEHLYLLIKKWWVHKSEWLSNTKKDFKENNGVRERTNQWVSIWISVTLNIPLLWWFSDQTHPHKQIHRKTRKKRITERPV